jgi:hypothetical protein
MAIPPVSASNRTLLGSGNSDRRKKGHRARRRDKNAKHWASPFTSTWLNSRNLSLFQP